MRGVRTGGPEAVPGAGPEALRTGPRRLPCRPVNEAPPPGIDKAAGKIQAMFSRIAPRYDLLNRLLSGGTDVAWRNEAARLLSPLPGEVHLDLCSGTGDLALAVSRRSGGRARVVAADFTFEMLALGKEKFRRNGHADPGGGSRRPPPPLPGCGLRRRHRCLRREELRGPRPRAPRALPGPEARGTARRPRVHAGADRPAGPARPIPREDARPLPRPSRLEGRHRPTSTSRTPSADGPPPTPWPPGCAPPASPPWTSTSSPSASPPPTSRGKEPHDRHDPRRHENRRRHPPRDGRGRRRSRRAGAPSPASP